MHTIPLTVMNRMRFIRVGTCFFARHFRVPVLTLIIATRLVLNAQAQDENEFEQVSAKTSYRIGGSIQEVFGLFTPRGRAKRLDKWTFEFIYKPEHALLSGTVFRQSYDAANIVQTWILNEAEFGKSLRYTTFINVGEVLETDLSFMILNDDSVEVTQRVRATATTQEINSAVLDYGSLFPEHSRNNGEFFSRILRERRAKTNPVEHSGHDASVHSFIHEGSMAERMTLSNFESSKFFDQ